MDVPDPVPQGGTGKRPVPCISVRLQTEESVLIFLKGYNKITYLFSTAEKKKNEDGGKNE